MNRSRPKLKISAARRILLVVANDAEADRWAKLAIERLSSDGSSVDVANSSEQALAKIESFEPALLVLDVDLPGLDSLEFLKQLRLSGRRLGAICMGQDPTPEDVARGLDAGADDYVRKPLDPLELAARVRAQLKTRDVADQLIEANAQLLELADIDDVTGLYNMRSVYERLGHELERGHRFGRSTAAVMLDIDNFKNANDANGHLFGTFALGEVGKIIHQAVRRVDIAARYGGDEFLVVLPETDLDAAAAFAERLRDAIAKASFRDRGSSMHLTASFGVAAASPGGSVLTSQGLVRCADLALYIAKASGKNCVRTHVSGSVGRFRRRRLSAVHTDA